MLQGLLARTQQVVEYMERQLTPPLSPKGMIIRVQAGFSSVSNAAYPDASDEETRQYGRLLERERNCLIQMVGPGRDHRGDYFPPVGPWDEGSRWHIRYGRLLDFLRSESSRHCELLISTKRERPNLLFFGEQILFEGHKTGSNLVMVGRWSIPTGII